MTTFAKLLDGTWGIRGQNLKPGEPVVITRKDGVCRTGTVGKVLKIFNIYDC